MGADPVSLGVTLALNAASMAMTASQKFEGQRLDSVQVTNADYGAPLFYFYGTRKNEGLSVIFAETLKEERHRNKTKGGKYNEYKYFGTWAVMIADQEIDEVLKVWFDEHLVYDATGAGPTSPFTVDGGSSILSYMRIYKGTADQDPDPRMLSTVEAREGVGSCPAYRGVAYIMFEDVPLEKLGNRLPQVKVLATRNGAPTYPYETYDSPTDQPNALYGWGWSPDRSRFIYSAGTTGNVAYAIWDTASRTVMVSGILSGLPIGLTKNIAIATAGQFYTIAEGGTSVLVYSADGIGSPLTYATLGTGASAVQLLKSSAGTEYLFFLPGLSDNVQYCTTANSFVFTVSAGAITGTAFIPRQYFIDAYDDVWVVGCSFALGVGTDDLCLWRVLNNSGRGGTTFKRITGLTTVIPGGFGYGFHAADSGQYVLYRAGVLFALDEDTLTVTDTQSSVDADSECIPQQFISLPVNAQSIFISGAAGGSVTEYSAATLAPLRTMSLGTWKVEDGDGTLYDPVNHALISAPQFVQVLTWRFLDRADGAGVTLQSIVEDVSERCGLVVANDIDASDLDQIVLGYSFVQGSGKNILENLLETYDSEARPHDFLLQFLKRGVAASGSIATALMGASQDGKAIRYKITRTLDTDLPLRISLTYADPDIDQQPNTVIAQRHAGAVESSRELSIDMSTWAATATEARSAVDGYLRRKWYNAEAYENSVTRAFSALEPADAKTLVFDGISKGAKLTGLTFQADGVMALKWERYSTAIHVAPTQAGAPADGVIPPVFINQGPTRGFVLDIPLVTDADEGLITYMTAGPYTAGAWPGAVFYQSFDAGATYTTEYGSVPSDHIDTWGTTSTALPDALTSVWDRGSTVSVFIQDGELTSTTEAAVENGANRALIGDEIVGFATATLTAPQTYSLSSFLRGRRGTEWATGNHAAGDKFILLATTALVRRVHGASDVGVTLYIKPVTASSPSTSGTQQTLVYTGASLKPYSPAHLKVTDDSGDLVFTWVRRTRIGGEWRDLNDAALGEGSEAYEAEVLDSGGLVLRTYTGLTTPTVTYTIAEQDLDFDAGERLRVYQMSTTVGRGFSSTLNFVTGVVVEGVGGGSVIEDDGEVTPPPPPPLPGGGGGYEDPREPVPETSTYTMVTAGAKTSQTTGSMSAGSTTLTVASSAGFAIGDKIIVEVGGEAGGGLRNTPGVGGQWEPTEASAYYNAVAVPKALMAEITNIVGTTWTLDTPSVAATTSANVYYDNLQAWETLSPDTWQPGFNGRGYVWGSGTFAGSDEFLANFHEAGTIRGAGYATTIFKSPKGCKGITFHAGGSIDWTFRDFGGLGNCKLQGYVPPSNIGGNNGGVRAFIEIIFGATGCIVQDIGADDFFQRVGVSAGAKGNLVRRIAGVQADPMGEYVTWIGVQDADNFDGDNPNVFEDVNIVCAKFCKAHESFSSRGTVMRRVGGTNVGLAINTAGGYSFDDCYSTIEADANVDNPAATGEPVFWINRNMGDAAPWRVPTMDGGGDVRRFILVQEAGGSYIDGSNMMGTYVSDGVPDVRDTDSSHTAPDYAGAGAGSQGFVSDDASTVLDGFVNVGSPNPGGAYFANIRCAGTVKNSAADSIARGTDGGGNTADVFYAL